MKFLTSNQKISVKIAPLSLAIISTLACVQAFAEESVPQGLTIEQLSGVHIEEKVTVFTGDQSVTKTKFANLPVKIIELKPTLVKPHGSNLNYQNIPKNAQSFVHKEPQKFSTIKQPSVSLPNFKPSITPEIKVEEPIIEVVKSQPITINKKPVLVIPKIVTKEPVLVIPEIVTKEPIAELVIKPAIKTVFKTPVTKPVVTDSINTVDNSPDSDAHDGGEAGIKTDTDTDTLNNLQPTVRPGTRVYKLSEYAALVNSSSWSTDMKRNTAMTVKLQALLDWNHASPGPIDGGWGMNSRKALKNFQAMKGIETTGKMNQATWDALTKNISNDEPVLYSYKITHADTKTKFTTIPAGYPAKSKLKSMGYNNIHEKMAERFQMDVRYLEKLNKGKTFTAGETITVYNASKPLKSRINRVVVNKENETLYAYNNEKLVATYPTTVGSSATPSPHGAFKVINKVKMPWYNATVGEEKEAEKYKIAPGPNNPVGVVWMGLSKPSYGIHGSPVPEGISRQASHGCIRLTNWDVLEVYDNIVRGAQVSLE